MSYDIYFMSRRDGQSWDEVLEAMEDAAERSEPIPARLFDAWDRIVPQARMLLGEVDITEYEQESRDLSHSGTGIDLSVFGDEVSITVPYWHAGEDAAVVLGKVFALSAIVEKETGLTAYDPQTERPLAEMQPQDAIGLMSRITRICAATTAVDQPPTGSVAEARVQRPSRGAHRQHRRSGRLWAVRRYSPTANADHR
ncbi:hypothetical protein ACH3WN_10650 [Streptomyces albogriseolus]|uniref:hypothetical protein n=1 Tax=Streptomyces albogriseolus TaxID=1887 RepID=UPI00378D22EA